MAESAAKITTSLRPLGAQRTRDEVSPELTLKGRPGIVRHAGTVGARLPGRGRRRYASWRWRGHAYLLSGPLCRRAAGDAVMLVGDAAGLAYPQSGEGIRPAIESGLIAASTIVEANGCYTRDRLEPYENHLQRRFGVSSLARLLSRALPSGVPAALALRLLDRPWFVRHVLLDRWFLHAQEPALALS